MNGESRELAQQISKTVKRERVGKKGRYNESGFRSEDIFFKKINKLVLHQRIKPGGYTLPFSNSLARY